MNVEAMLQIKKSKGEYRTRKVIESVKGPEIKIEGKPYLAFCSNDYLGLSEHREVINAFCQAAKQWGVGSRASGWVVGHHLPHQALEAELAFFLKRSRALVFSSGYMANLGVVNALARPRDTIILDRLAHASLLDAVQLSHAELERFHHNNTAHLAKRLEETRRGTCFVVTEGVFSMEGDVSPLPEISRLALQYQATLLVDDAHGFGFMGDKHQGTVLHFGLGENEVPLLVGTFGKALGSFGAFVSGEDAMIEYLLQSARTCRYTTALPPAIAEATRVSLKLIQTETWRQQHLKERIQEFKKGMADLKMTLLPSDSPIQPLMLWDSKKALQLSELLKTDGIYIPAILSPTVPKDRARLRVVLSANHTKDQVERLLMTFQKILKQTGSLFLPEKE